MKDQPSTSDKDDDFPVRFSVPQPKMEEFMVYHPDVDGYIPPGAESTWDAKAWLREYEEEKANLTEEERNMPMITVDDLRAAGALESPKQTKPKRRKPPAREERDLFSDLKDNQASDQ